MLGLRPQELLIIAVIIIVIFGGSQLPKIARNLGQAQNELRKGFQDAAADDEDSDGTTA